jgi:20S proteasome alpha/beta subunit
MAIGARSQSAKTYLERHLDEFVEADLEALVAHGLRALRDTLPNEIELNSKVSKADIQSSNLRSSFSFYTTVNKGQTSVKFNNV